MISRGGMNARMGVAVTRRSVQINGKCAKVRGGCTTCAARDFMPISDKVSAGEWLFYLTVFDGRCDE